MIGFEVALRGSAKDAERAVEAACLRRFGTLRPPGPTPTIRCDDALIFQSQRFRAACRDDHLKQEFITPYPPEQHAMIERFFRTLKEECVWQHNFASFFNARKETLSWIDWYKSRCPYSALGYLSPGDYRVPQLTQVAGRLGGALQVLAPGGCDELDSFGNFFDVSGKMTESFLGFRGRNPKVGLARLEEKDSLR